jgi:hypothetical protein
MGAEAVDHGVKAHNAVLFGVFVPDTTEVLGSHPDLFNYIGILFCFFTNIRTLFQPTAPLARNPAKP